MHCAQGKTSIEDSPRGININSEKGGIQRGTMRSKSERETAAGHLIGRLAKSPGRPRVSIFFSGRKKSIGEKAFREAGRRQTSYVSQEPKGSDGVGGMKGEKRDGEMGEGTSFNRNEQVPYRDHGEEERDPVVQKKKKEGARFSKRA